MESVSLTGRGKEPIRFAAFEVDLLAHTLRKSGVRIRLQEKPFRLLVLLLSRPGEVVTREELQRDLWPNAEYGEFDLGLNTAVKKLRQTLGDSADNPKWIETIPKVGYRFLAPVDDGSARSALQSQDSLVPLPATLPLKPWGALFRSITFFGADRVFLPERRQLVFQRRFALATLLAFAVAGWSALWLSGPESVQEVPHRQFTIQPRGLFGVGSLPGVNRPVISPDGRFIAYLGSEFSLWVYDLANGDDREIEGVESTGWFSWSPDSQWICYVSMGQLFKTSVESGGPQKLADITWPGFFGSSWRPDGQTIVFSAGTPARLYEVPSNGGRPQLLSEKNVTSKERVNYVNPHFAMNDSRRRLLLYFERSPEGGGSIIAEDLDSGERREVESGGFDWPFYSTNGHLLLSKAGEYFALPFSTKTLKAQGDPFPIGGRRGSGSGFASVSCDGTLVYEDKRPGLRQLVWVNRQGNKVGTISDPHPVIGRPRLSPDGRRIVAQVRGEDDSFNLWVSDLERDSSAPLTFDRGHDAVWTADASRILYTGPGWEIFVKPADGSGGAEPFLVSPGFYPFIYPFDVSRDGHLVYVSWTPAAGSDILYAQLRQDSKLGEPVLFASTRFDEHSPALSPDGRFLAYESDESGRYEVYLQPFPKGGRKVKVSAQGGRQPRWRGDGKELFYVEKYGLLVAVPIALSQEISSGDRQELFREPNLLDRGQSYDAATDGQRFVVIETLDDSGHIEGFRVVQNWFAPFRD